MSATQWMRWAMVPVLLAGSSLSAQHFVDRGSMPTYSLGTIGDFDGSGQLDVVCGYTELYLIRDPLAGNSIPQAQIVPFGPLGSRLERGTVADFNADGIDDLLVVGGNSMGATMTVLYGSPQGFQPSTQFVQLGSNDVSMAVTGDFNGDGRMDFAVEAGSFFATTTQVVLFAQDAQGQFARAFAWPPDSNTTYVVVGDYNGDGYDDLSYASSRPPASGGVLNVLWGSPSLAPNTQVVPYGFGGNRVANEVADMNGDGYDDSVFAEVGSTVGFQVLFGDPVLGLRAGPVTRATPGNQGFGMSLADVDGDGFPEAMYDDGGSTSFIVRNDGSGTFQRAAWLFQTGGSNTWRWYRDLDGDGDMDIVRGNRIHENLAIHGDGCAGTLGVPEMSIGTAVPGAPAFTVRLSNALPMAPQQLFIASGTPRDSGWNPGCGIQVRLEPQFLGEPTYWPWFTDSTDANGGATRVFQIPAQVAAQVAGPFVLQWAVLDPAGAFQAPPGVGVAISRARTLRIF